MSLIKTEPSVHLLVMQTDGVCHVADGHFFEMCVSLAPSATYKWHDDAAVSNTAPLHVWESAGRKEETF